MGLIMNCLCCGTKVVLIAGDNPQIADGECLTCFGEYQGDYHKHPRHKEKVWTKEKTGKTAGVKSA